MRKIFFIVSIFLAAAYCLGCAPKENTAVSIGNNIKITPQELSSAFAKSPYASSPTKENRKLFLDVYINRKLILNEASKEGLDKDPELLESIQYFWEQALLKLTLNKKMKELASQVKVSDQEINDYFQKHKSEFPGKNMTDAYETIKLQLFIEKQKKTLDDWMNYLRANGKIKIDSKLLGLE